MVSEDDAELGQVVAMLESAGLIESHELEDGRVVLRLTDQGQALELLLPDDLDVAEGPDSSDPATD
jgi:hypothetical protein